MKALIRRQIRNSRGRLVDYAHSLATQEGWRTKQREFIYANAFDALAPEMEPDPKHPFLLAQHSACLLAYAARNALHSLDTLLRS
jgi:hypothetical protein